MRQIVVEGELFRECGRGIREGFRRLASTMCFLVVRVSQIGVERESSVSSSSTSARRDCLVEDFADSVEVDLMCANRAFEAFNVCSLLNWYGEPLSTFVVSAVEVGAIL